MSGSFGSYDERTFPRGSGNGYTDSRTINVQDVVDDLARHMAAGKVSRGSGAISPHHSYESCRECVRVHSNPQRDPGLNAVAEYVRRNHRQVDKINRTISAKAVWSEIHPKVKQDGSFPKEFLLPKTVDAFRAMDTSVLDRILLAYQLSVNIDQRKSRQESKHKKLYCLFEFLGADHLLGKRSEVREEDPHHARHERNGISGW